MSQSPPNYVAGVPVKISERFRPPPRISLPQSVANRLAQVDGVGSRVLPSYDFKLEETVLKRITEWRAVKERDRYERAERVRLKEQELARMVEEEQKRKLNQISYPNTDDLSSASEEEEASEENDDSVPSGSSEEHGHQQRGTRVQARAFDTILLPTVLPEVAAKNRISCDEVISSGLMTSVNIPKSTSVQNNNNNGYNKINYSDFENDTSSPFDNMELKTMNDLDILAQVLNLNVSNSGSEPSPEESQEVQSNSTKAEANIKKPEPLPEEKPAPATQQQFDYSQQYPHPTYQLSHQQTPSSNDYYESYNNSYHYSYCQYPPNSTTSANNSQYNSASYQPNNTQSQYQTYNYFPYTSSVSNAATTRPTYAPSYLYSNAYASYNYPNQSTAAATTTTTTVPSQSSSFYTPTTTLETSQADSVAAIRSKSKSVPDIVRQLDEEVQDSAMKRTRNNSQSNAEARQNEEPATSNVVVETSNMRDFTFYNQLSAADQNLVKRIGSMGFPLERVAAVLKRLGSDDKKIVEHLIPLSELLDLGFEEERISDALIRCGNNKHKALDDLLKS